MQACSCASTLTPPQPEAAAPSTHTHTQCNVDPTQKINCNTANQLSLSPLRAAFDVSSSSLFLHYLGIVPATCTLLATKGVHSQEMGRLLGLTHLITVGHTRTVVQPHLWGAPTPTLYLPLHVSTVCHAGLWATGPKTCRVQHGSFGRCNTHAATQS